MATPVSFSLRSSKPQPTEAKLVARRGRLSGFLVQARQAAVLALACVAVTSFAQDKPWHNIGRDATPAEVKAWDIDVRPDFKGLPKGAGSVDMGVGIWEAKCASCHGSFGESNEVFTPIVGGTTADDIKTGRVQGLLEGKAIAPQRTTFMKVATLSTLWDYINRAMPWNEPKSLSADEVFAVTAYLLNLAEVVPADFTLSDKNIAEVQQRMPNRNGMVFYEPLWRVDGKGDTNNVACMKNCATDEAIRSSLPAFARDAHGNIAEQNRIIGPVRGADTTKPAPTGPVGSAPRPQPVVVAAASGGAADVKTLLGANACLACHGVKNKIVGPGFAEVVVKHKGRPDLEIYLLSKIKGGGVGVYGGIPMPAQPQLSDADAKAIAQWIAAGAP